MVTVELLPDSELLVLTPHALLEQSDFERVAREMDPLIAKAGKIGGLMIEVESFPGWPNVGVFVSHLKFIIDHHRRIERIALVTENGVLKMIARVAALFVKPTIRQFAAGDKARALTWLEPGN